MISILFLNFSLSKFVKLSSFSTTKTFFGFFFKIPSVKLPVPGPISKIFLFFNIYNIYYFINYILINKKVLSKAFFSLNHLLSKNSNDLIKLIGFEIFFPIIFSFGP